MSRHGSKGLLLIAIATLLGCQSTMWGPMAVIDEEADTVAASLGGAGELRITDECITLLRDDEADEITLVWRDSQVSWDDSGKRIEFNDRLSGESVELHDGSRIEVGGAGESSSPWIAEPDTSCPSEAFVVHSVTQLD